MANAMKTRDVKSGRFVELVVAVIVGMCVGVATSALVVALLFAVTWATGSVIGFFVILAACAFVVLERVTDENIKGPISSASLRAFVWAVHYGIVGALIGCIMFREVPAVLGSLVGGQLGGVA